MRVRPPGWAVRAALLCAAGCGTLALFAPGVVRLILASGLPVFPGGRSPGYYAARLRETALCWALLLPALVVTAGAIRARWRALAGRPSSTSASPAWRLAAWVLLVGVLVASVPRERTGDEPSYLAMAQAVAEHGTLVLERGRLDAHLSAVSNEARSVHGPGMGILLAIPFLVGGRTGVSLALVAIGVALVLVAREMLAAAVERELADFLALVLAVTFPLVTYAPLVLAEVAGALGLSVLHWRVAQRGRPGPECAVALAALPWLHVRFILPAAIYAAWGVIGGRGGRARAAAWLGAPFAASLAVMAWLNLRWFGSPSPLAMWGGRGDLISLRGALPGALGVFVDQQYGLLFWAPVFVLLPLGFRRLVQRSRAQAWLVAAVVVSAVGPGILHEWWAGWSPAARFLVPVTGQLVLLAALGLELVLRGGAADRAAAGVLVAGQVAIGAVCALVPGKVFGTFTSVPRNYYLDLLARGLGADPSRLLPSLRSSPGGWTLIAAAALVGAWLGLALLWSLRLERLTRAAAGPAGAGRESHASGG